MKVEERWLEGESDDADEGAIPAVVELHRCLLPLLASSPSLEEPRFHRHWSSLSPQRLVVAVARVAERCSTHKRENKELHQSSTSATSWPPLWVASSSLWPPQSTDGKSVIVPSFVPLVFRCVVDTVMVIDSRGHRVFGRCRHCM
ncbi:hypothetical protein PIB30_077210 [Stylosanthes scabra]|uniref:Uncharacterized protein n=1 Tax=Stylosanthes scabra TaxID=79078 RepID=A0ABU6XNX8_9FABA|nr:hypothetical protein [Stylosanthes scabra]